MAETYVNRQYVAWPWGMRVFFCEEQRDFGIGTSGEQPPLSCGATFDSTCGSLFIVRFVEELRKHRLNLTCRTRRISKDFFQEFFFSSFRYFAPILRKRIYHLGDSYDSQDGIVLLEEHRGASLLNNCQSGFTFNGHTLYYCQMVRWSFYLFSVKSTLFSLLSLLFHVFLQLLSSSIFKVQFQMYK